MIEEVRDADLFVIQADAIVNPVNCKGVMGKGIALEMKKRYPRSYRAYKAACEWSHLRPGVLLYVAGQGGERSVVHFPTKDHWTQPSRLEWIQAGLEDLQRHYAAWGLKSIAMPQLGCGLGGLNWDDVRPLFFAALEPEPLKVIVSLSTADLYEGCAGQRSLFR
ncbi:MAG TPA: macro domain-containing protein [Armatimonadota bacterium]|nr:macro domain-containing protein [Armatimonadota bacterium]